MKFNTTTESSVEQNKTTNMAGGEAFEVNDPRKSLSMVVINNLLEDSYYESDEESLAKVIRRFEECAREYPEFTMQLAAWTREVAYIRQIPQLLLVLASNHRNTKEYVNDYASWVIQRADEPLEALAMQVNLSEDLIPNPNEWKVEGQSSLFGRSVPRPLRRAIGDNLRQFDEYQFAKYDTDSREFQYRDLMNLVHPTPRDEEHERIFEKIVHGDLSDYPDVEPLRQHRTWENRSSSDEYESDRDMWRDTLPEMGLFAKIRNVRNMLEAGVSDTEILDESDLGRIRDSKILPFRFYQAYDAITPNRGGFGSYSGDRLSTDYLDEWFEDAIDLSVSNVPDELNDTYVGVDLSGSMSSTISSDSTLERREIAALFGSITSYAGAGVSGFATDYTRFSFHSRTPVLQRMKEIVGASIGMSTNGHLVLRDLIENNVSHDTIVLFTDEQMWDSSWNSSDSVRQAWDDYTSIVNEDATLYVVNLAAYGEMSMPSSYHNVYHVSGWNDAMLDHIKYVGSDNRDLMVEEIGSFGQ